MNATTLSELRQGSRDISDEKMDQVRELLFGEDKRRTDAVIARLETRILELETTLFGRIAAIEARLAGLATDTEAGRRAAFEELSRHLGELSSNVGRIGRE